MKKIVSLILSLSLIFALCACGQKAAQPEDTSALPEQYAQYQALIDALENGKYEQAHAIINAMDPSPATPAPTPAPYVESVKIFYYTNDLTGSDFTMTLSQGEDGDITLKAEAYPLTAESKTFTWSVDKDGIVELTPNENGSECKVHQVGVLETGVVITLKCAGATCTVRCIAVE